MVPCFQLVGLPGSGKSTLRSFIAEQHGFSLRDAVVVSIDDFIHSVRGDKSYAEAFAENVEEATIHVGEQLAFAHRMRLPTIIDMTNLTRAHRRKNAEALPTHRHIAVVPQVPKHVRLQRLARRTTQIIPGEVLAMMTQKYEPPDLAREHRLSEVRYYDCV